MVTSWYYLGVGAVFIYLLFGNCSKAPSRRQLRTPFTWYCSAMLIEAAFTLIRAGNYRSPHSLMLTEYWANGMQWLAVGVASIMLVRLIGSEDDAVVVQP